MTHLEESILKTRSGAGIFADSYKVIDQGSPPGNGQEEIMSISFAKRREKNQPNKGKCQA